MTTPTIPPSIRADLFGGTGEVRVHDLLQGRRTAPFTAVLWCELAPEGHVGRHLQEHFPEVVVGIEGDGIAEVNGVEQPLATGDVAHLPLGSVLSLRNRSSTEPLRYLIIKAQS